MPSLMFYLIVFNGFILCYGSKHDEHACIHDEIAEKDLHIVSLGTAARTKNNKRQASTDYSSIRIHPVFTNIDSTVESTERSIISSVSASIETLERILMVHPVLGNLVIPPQCVEFTFGVNVGKCQDQYPLQYTYSCGELANISQEYIGVREVCSSSDGPCSLQGPNSTGIPDADFLLYVSATSTSDCSGGTLAYASACMLDATGNNRPVAGFINICPSSILHFHGQSSLVYNLILHEIIHAIGFSSSLFSWFTDENGDSYDPSKATDQPYRGANIFTGPKTKELAKSYYSCENLEGLFLENEGGSGTASSHWEKRTLNNEIMNGYSSSDYEVLSEFTLAFFEDTGWYEANYTALSELNQNSLLWGKGLGCSFVTQRCSNANVFPYLCEDNTDETMCTYDHLSKGICSNQYNGFDGCPVRLAADVTRYCRTELDITVMEEVEDYGIDSICVHGVKSLSFSCGTYIIKPVVPLCIQQTTYTQNNNIQYIIQVQNRSYVCMGGRAVITDTRWVIQCPPTEDVVLQATVTILGEPPKQLSSKEIATNNLDSLRNLVLTIDQDVVAFGGIRLAQVSARLYINSANGDPVPICHLSGCTTCNDSIMIENDNTTIISDDNVYSVKGNSITGRVIFRDTQSQGTDYSLLLMFNPLANYSFVHYVISVHFMDELRSSHLKYQVVHIIALADNTAIHIASNTEININGMIVTKGEDYLLTMSIGDTLTISSGEDLTGSRVTSNKAVSLFFGHYCEDTTCSLFLLQQIPPFNSWGSYFIMHTNISHERELIGNWIRLLASDIGANVTLNCTTDEIYYESSYYLDFREHILLLITHDHCAITSDENILIIQFQNSTKSSADTFMLVVPGLVHYENHYVFHTVDNFSVAVMTVPTENPTFNPLQVNKSIQFLDWKRIELNTEIYYYTTLSLPAGTHTIRFVGNHVTFGITVYGGNTTDTYAIPAGMRLDLITDLPMQAPSPVQDPTLTLVDGIVEVTWEPPAVPNGIIYQYIVQRINASGRFFKHIIPNQLNTSLAYYNDALVSVAAVNLYAQSEFEHAESEEACLPSPCINGGTCMITMDGGSQEIFHCICTPQFSGEYCETTASRTNAPPTTSQPSTNTSDSNKLIIIIIVTISATIVALIVIGPVLFLYIRQKLIQRAKIVDISQITKSAGSPKAKPSNQFMVRGTNDKAFFYINYPQNPSINDGNSDTNSETCRYT